MNSLIVIIDDDSAFKRVLEFRIKSFLPTATITHFDTLAKARIGVPALGDSISLVILDEHLPDGRGNELLAEGLFKGLAVLSVSSDEAPEIPGNTLQAGASFFLSKARVSEKLFKPLILGLIDRNKLQRELNKAHDGELVLETIKTLVSTLRHEINNPLGAVLGAAYLLRKFENASREQKEAAELVEASGQRIKHVLDELCKAVSIEAVSKANHKVFQIPGDAPWDDQKK